MAETLVRYKDFTLMSSHHTGLAVTLIHTWRRSEWEIQHGYFMSTSSGPRDYLNNQIISVFQADPEIDAVSWVISARATAKKGVPFLVIRKGTRYFDVTGREVEVLVKQTAVQP